MLGGGAPPRGVGAHGMAVLNGFLLSLTKVEGEEEQAITEEEATEHVLEGRGGGRWTVPSTRAASLCERNSALVSFLQEIRFR